MNAETLEAIAAEPIRWLVITPAGDVAIDELLSYGRLGSEQE